MGALVTTIAVVASLVVISGFYVGLLVYRSRQWITLPGTGIKQTDQPFPDAEVFQAVKIFEGVWRDNFGLNQKVLDAIWTVKIKWIHSMGFDLPEPYDLRATGWNPSGNTVWVATRMSENIAATALFHELVHVVLRLTTGESDPDHEGDEYPGWTSRHTEAKREAQHRFSEWRISEGLA